MIELRFYRQRYRMDVDYYEGDDDIFAKFWFTYKQLKYNWSELLKYFEGDTYSAWYEDECVCGGAFDPDDLEIIEDNIRVLE